MSVITASPVFISLPEGQDIGNLGPLGNEDDPFPALATFNDSDPSVTPDDFTISINWGDGSSTPTFLSNATNPGLIQTDSAAGGPSGEPGFMVANILHHIYTEEGNYTVTVNIYDNLTGLTQVRDGVEVSDAFLELTGSTPGLEGAKGLTFGGAGIATFKDGITFTNTSSTASDFTAKIDWGDGTSAAPGTVTVDAEPDPQHPGGFIPGSFIVNGPVHTYNNAGVFIATVTINDVGGAPTVYAFTHVTVGLSAQQGSLPSGIEGTAISGPLATIADGNPGATSFTATINWGDNTASAGTVVGNTVNGAHTYTEEGSYTPTVTITDNTTLPGNSVTVIDPTVTVTDASLTPGAGAQLAGIAGTAINAANIATFYDPGDPFATPSNYTVMIDWGDGNPGHPDIQTFPGANVIVSNGGGFTVNGGPHTYGTAGIFNPIVTITDDGTAQTQVDAQVTVAAPTPPTLLPDRTGVNVGKSVTADAAHGVLANDTDPIPHDTLHVSAVNGQPVPAGNVGLTIAGTYGSLTLKSDGSYAYTAFSHDVLPASGIAPDVFHYTASTGQGGTADSTLTVIVMAPGLNYFGPTPPSTTITGLSGHSPVLDGGAGGLKVVATDGATVLIGGPGDTLTGGNGADTFEFIGHFGQNTITNYNPNKDLIALDHNDFTSLAAIVPTQPTGTHNTLITDTAGDAVTLLGVIPSQLHLDHFLLV
jgi:hypothetical protein